MSVRIERLQPSEWERLRAVRLAALKSDPAAFGTTHAQCLPWPESRWRDQLRVLTSFVAVHDTQDVGMVRGIEHESLASAVYLISMWVAPQARRRGVGWALIDAVCDWARGVKRPVVYLDVREHNAPAIALYEAYGFRATGERTPEAGAGDPRVEARYALDLR